MTYSYRIADGTDLRASTPVLLANDVHLVPGDGDGGVTLAAFTASLAASCDAWFRTAAPVTDDALLELGLVVFANVEDACLPIARFGSIPVQVPDGWWTAG